MMPKDKLVKLSIGVRVVLVPKNDRVSTAIGIFADVGGRYEPKKVSGISHFIEHLVFKGTKTYSNRAIKEEIEGRGGMLNAFTDEETTCYYAKVLSKDTGVALSILSDMVLEPNMHKVDIDQERGVIIEEIQMYKDHPGHWIMDLMNEMMWPGQSLGRLLTGTEETLKVIGQKELFRFMGTHYTASHLVVAVAGRLNEDRFIKDCERIFQHLKKGDKKTSPPARERAQGPYLRWEKKKTEQAHVCLGFPAYKRDHADRFVLELMNIVLGGNMSSRLFQAIREDRGLAYEIKSGYSKLNDTGLFTIYAGLASKNLEEAMNCLCDVLKDLKNALVGKDELNRAKKYCSGSLSLYLEGTTNTMMWQGESVLFRNKLRSTKDMLAGIESVRAEAIQRVARDILKSNKCHMVMIANKCPEQKLVNILKQI